jgi:uncharacterized protein YgiM (DUF1202 family)
MVEFISSRYNAINLNDTALISGVSFAFAMLLATVGLFLVSWRRRIIFGISVALGLVFLFSTGILLQKMQGDKTTVEAVVMTEEADAYSGPGEENTHIFTIHEGTKIIIERSQGDWNLIRLKSGAGGWIKSNFIEKI